jgi:hypothetical protein
MPLDNATLQAQLEDALSGVTPAPTAQDAGTLWAGLYDAYARTGTANGVPPIVPPIAATTLGAALGAQFAIVPGSPPGAAAGIATAFLSYWPQAVFAGMIAPPAPGGGPALIASLTAIFSVIGGTHALKAAQITTALQAFTNAVIVTFPPAVPAPVI